MIMIENDACMLMDTAERAHGEEHETLPPSSESAPQSESRVQFPSLSVHHKLNTPSKSVQLGWIRQQTAVSAGLQDSECMSVINVPFNLHPSLVSALQSNGIQSLFPVQHSVMAHMLGPHVRNKALPARDLCISSPTGSGKTLCYVLPIVNELACSCSAQIAALVVLPTQQLAAQVYDVFVKYTDWLPHINVLLLSNQKDLMAERNLMFHQSNQGVYECVGAQIVVATVGRLVDHLQWQQAGLGEDSALADTCMSLGALQYLVIDEADALMAHSHLHWLTLIEQNVRSNTNYSASRTQQSAAQAHDNRLGHLLNPVQTRVQKILVSATLSLNPELLHQWPLFRPKLFAASNKPLDTETQTNAHDVAMGEGRVQGADTDADKQVLPSQLVHEYCVVKIQMKPLALHVLINLTHNQSTRILCFVNSREDAHRLCAVLQQLADNQYKVDVCTANMMSKQQNRAKQRFITHQVRVLVCSSVLARGCDFGASVLVVNYERPIGYQQYVHRAGRAARANAPGTVVTICNTTAEVQLLLKDVKGVQLTEIVPELDELSKRNYARALKDTAKAMADRKKQRKSQSNWTK